MARNGLGFDISLGVNGADGADDSSCVNRIELVADGGATVI